MEHLNEKHLTNMNHINVHTLQNSYPTSKKKEAFFYFINDA